MGQSLPYCIWLLAAITCAAEEPATIRSWGNNEMAALLDQWEAAFRKQHPAVRFEDRLFGPASAMAGIYTGVADLSWMGHEIRTEESMGFEWVFQYKALGIEVATASLDVHDHGAQLVVFVHRDNPIRHLTLAQLDAIFGAEHRRGPRNIRTWGELGLSGGWAERPIHVYGYHAETEAGSFFRQAVLAGSYKWNCDLKDFADEQRDDGSKIDAAPRIVSVLASDRFGIAYAKLRYATAWVKPLPLAARDSEPYFEPTRENVKKRLYPLTRSMTVYLNRAPNRPVDPKVREFLRYVLSREGQEAVVREGGYLPLLADVAAQQLRKLE